MTEQEAMLHALTLALRGWGRVAPNPLVGCVLLQQGEVVGEGWHAEFGEAHAERMALVQAGTSARGATAVVTLEPCAHQGKQPPCVDALIEAGIKRVVIAVADPNPEARGGIAKLRAAGIEVDVGMMEEEARRLNAPFFHRFADTERPWVALKLATSVEGWIAPADRTRRQLSGVEAQEWLHWFRAGFDAIGIGGATALIDDPTLTVRGTLVPRVPPMRVVFAGGAPIPTSLQIRSGEGPRTVVLGTSGIGVPSLKDGLKWLRGEGVGSLLIEGGGRLGSALLALGVVDRCYWIRTPVLLGPEGVPGYPWGAAEAPAGWKVTERKSLGPDILQVMEPA